MYILPIFLLIAASTQPRVSIVDTQHTRLSRIMVETMSDELRTRNIDVTPGGYVAEIVDVSDSSGTARTSWVQVDMTHAVQVTEVVGGAAAEVRLFDGDRKLIASYKLTGSGSSSAAVGARKVNPSPFLFGPLLRRSRSAEAARAIAHDIAASIAAAVNSPGPDTPQR